MREREREQKRARKTGMKAKCKWGDSVREIMRNNKRGEKGRKRKREERKSLG